jgi:hypothetical protein
MRRSGVTGTSSPIPVAGSIRGAEGSDGVEDALGFRDDRIVDELSVELDRG